MKHTHRWKVATADGVTERICTICHYCDIFVDKFILNEYSKRWKTLTNQQVSIKSQTENPPAPAAKTGIIDYIGKNRYNNTLQQLKTLVEDNHGRAN